MTIETLDLKDTNSFSSFFLDYINDHPELKPFYGLRPEIGSFENQIGQKSFDQEKRNVLQKALRNQYDGYDLSGSVSANLELLSESKTFTITTGHQLNLCTGPFYFIYKIVTVINTCKQLKEAYPDYNFVPVYWMASEDHDFDEINYFNLFGKKIQWNTEQTGAVGRFKTAGLREVLESMPEKVELFEKAYREYPTLAGAVRYYVNELFGNQGLVVLDGDDKDLKSEFSSVMLDDILTNEPNRLVEKTNDSLNELGYKTQVFPRSINLFYLRNGIRSRLVNENGTYSVLDEDIHFSEEEIKSLVKDQPELFSPNVVLRPLYQETILPNLAYVGGPAEVIYWLQLKAVFDHYNTTFPILMPRNFGLYVNKPSLKKMTKLGVSSADLFLDDKTLKAHYIRENSNNEVSLDAEMNELKEVFDHISKKADTIDGSLSGFIGAEYNKSLKSVENIEKRLKKSEEKRHEIALNQLEGLKSKLFPNGVLQERSDNFLNVYINRPDLLDTLIQKMDPFNYQFYVFKED